MKLRGDQVAVVTGAAAGIGQALATELVGRGLRVVLADVDGERLEQAASALAEQGEVLAVRTDVADSVAVQALADRTVERFGRVDLVVNNAGLAQGGAPLWETDPAESRRVVEVNLLGVLHGIRAFVPGLVAAGQGHLLNVASLAGLMSPPLGGAYGATKSAVIGLSEALRAELDLAGATEVGVSVACPALVRTPMVAAMFASMRARTDLPADVVAGVEAGAATAIEPAEAARRMLAGVEENRLHILTNGDPGGAARARTERVLGLFGVI